MLDTEQQAHSYERDDLMERLHEGLEKAGLADKQLTLQDLAPLDQFHSRGMEATKDLADAVQVSGETKVLDIGSGLGGPARYLASRFGCKVQGIDFTQSYVDAATFLSERLGLQDKVSFQQADALALPFDESTFDLAWTQHVAMNIANREKLYAEAYRVLKTGGQLAIYDVVTGPNGDMTYPAPWSLKAETSYVISADEMRDLLAKQGFKITHWIDRTADGVTWFDNFLAQRSQTPAAPNALNLTIAAGADFGQRAANLTKSLKEGRAGLIEAVVTK